MSYCSKFPPVGAFLKLVRPGGLRAVVAESLLLKHQILISNRSRRRVDAWARDVVNLFLNGCRGWVSAR